MEGEDLKGWFGNHSDWNISVSTLTRVRDCPVVKIKFKKEKRIVVEVLQEKYDRNMEGFKVFLSNRESASLFLQQKFDMEGSPLESNRNPPGYQQYRLKGL